MSIIERNKEFLENKLNAQIELPLEEVFIQNDTFLKKIKDEWNKEQEDKKKSLFKRIFCSHSRDYIYWVNLEINEEIETNQKLYDVLYKYKIVGIIEKNGELNIDYADNSSEVNTFYISYRNKKVFTNLKKDIYVINVENLEKNETYNTIINSYNRSFCANGLELERRYDYSIHKKYE